MLANRSLLVEDLLWPPSIVKMTDTFTSGCNGKRTWTDFLSAGREGIIHILDVSDAAVASILIVLPFSIFSLAANFRKPRFMAATPSKRATVNYRLFMAISGPLVSGCGIAKEQ
jgi:hypothetical protein